MSSDNPGSLAARSRRKRPPPRCGTRTYVAFGRSSVDCEQARYLRSGPQSGQQQLLRVQAAENDEQLATMRRRS